MSTTFRAACIAALLALYALASYLDALSSPAHPAKACAQGEHAGDVEPPCGFGAESVGVHHA
jgi:hypothetical protein